MQNWPLTVTYALEYAGKHLWHPMAPPVQQLLPPTPSITCVYTPAARWHPEQQIVCKTVEGPLVVSTYADLSRRAQLCALALKALAVG